MVVDEVLDESWDSKCYRCNNPELVNIKAMHTIRQ